MSWGVGYREYESVAEGGTESAAEGGTESAAEGGTESVAEGGTEHGRVQHSLNLT